MLEYLGRIAVGKVYAAAEGNAIISWFNQLDLGEILDPNSDPLIQLREYLDVKVVKVVKDESSDVAIKDVKGIAMSKFCDEFTEVLERSLGCLKGYVHKIKMKEGSKPVVWKVRKVLYEIRKAVVKEMEKLEEDGVINKLKGTEWLSPVMIARKQN
ncbi:hypothetical protein NDU88_008687 [Pleurodeles waltl]|uniref:Uncharacterized protein n=1 Tax=Pleurodeles waltl TaxID=8319 RepID=A0AAV7PR36_PLEWA|nr:hypothetical protein NDU88_008687 [Pleurodeles waltl]